jgi:hypothetical protein
LFPGSISTGRHSDFTFSLEFSQGCSSFFCFSTHGIQMVGGKARAKMYSFNRVLSEAWRLLINGSLITLFWCEVGDRPLLHRRGWWEIGDYE